VIVVRIEMWPHGDRLRARELGRMYLANDGTGSAERGNYDVAVCRKGTNSVPRPISPNGPDATRAGRVESYPRQAYNVWRLIARALRSAFPEEK
jgi:hypothetical protein